jgi:hypothetical protein
VRGKNLEDTAHQEAGHAVAAWWLGQIKKRDLVTIVPDPRTAPRFSEMAESSGNSGYCDRMVLQAEKFVVVCLAGNSASCRYPKNENQAIPGGRPKRPKSKQSRFWVVSPVEKN